MIHPHTLITQNYNTSVGNKTHWQGAFVLDTTQPM